MPILLEQISPHENLQAVVEEDAGAVYFYLCGAEGSGFGTRACWVRNVVAAPEEIMFTDGAGPLLSAQHCCHPEGSAALDPAALSVVWLEEGDGAALMEGDRILAIIPSWSGQQGFCGYALDCRSESPLAWPLTADNALVPRVLKAMQYWRSWEQESSPWREAQENLLAAYESTFGAHDAYYAIDGGVWPPKAVVETKIAGGTTLLTVGICLRAQPTVELYTEDPTPWRRFELGMALSDEFDDSVIKSLGGYISGQSRLPWDKFSWLGPGHTIRCQCLPGFSAMMLCAKPDGAPAVVLPPWDGEPVNLYWLVPITDAELEFAMKEHSPALLEKLAAQGPFWIHRQRQSVV